MVERRRYAVLLVVNGRKILEVIIDPHYEERHPDISDDLILKLVRRLSGSNFSSKSRTNHWTYYSHDQVDEDGKKYRLVWCLEDGSSFLGIINCYRRSL